MVRFKFLSLILNYITNPSPTVIFPYLNYKETYCPASQDTADSGLFISLRCEIVSFIRIRHSFWSIIWWQTPFFSPSIIIYLNRFLNNIFNIFVIATHIQTKELGILSCSWDRKCYHSSATKPDDFVEIADGIWCRTIITCMC